MASMQPAEGETRRDCWTVAFGKKQNLLLSTDLVIVLAYFR